MKKSPFAYGDKFDFTTYCLIFATLLIATAIFNVYYYPPSKITTEQTKLAAVHNSALSAYYQTDSLKTIKVSRGDSLRILGVTKNDNRMWVETASGERGFMPQEDADNKFVIISNGGSLPEKLKPIEGDTVRIKSCDKHRKKFTCIDKNGNTITVGSRYLVSATAQPFCENAIKSSDLGYYMTIKKFESKYLGKSFVECDSLYRPALYVKQTADGKVASFPLYVFNPTDGCTYRPVVTFDGNGVAQSYILKKNSARNSFILKCVPGVSLWIDNDFVARMIEGNLYSSWQIKQFGNKWVDNGIRWAGAIIAAPLALMWATMLGFAPLLLLTFLIRIPVAYKRLSNKQLKHLLQAVAVIGNLLWIVPSLVWGTYWWALALGIYFASKVLFGNINLLLSDEAVMIRCSECKNLYSMEFAEREYIGESTEWCNESESHVIDSKTHKWKETINTLTRYVNHYGSTVSSSSSSYTKEHAATTRVYQSDNYEVQYLVKTYKDWYECADCHRREYVWHTERTVIDRRYKGSDVYSSSTTDY